MQPHASPYVVALTNSENDLVVDQVKHKAQMSMKSNEKNTYMMDHVSLFKLKMLLLRKFTATRNEYLISF